MRARDRTAVGWFVGSVGTVLVAVTLPHLGQTFRAVGTSELIAVARECRVYICSIVLNNECVN